MGERKGQNKYYPPDYDPTKGGLNKFLGTHALRERARKLHLGILIIRFEMPYNCWCSGCGNHIGMGVRYNAEKTKVGMYYSTPVYQFRMKCHLCENHIEMKTDPGNLDYVIVSGASRQERRWDPTTNGQIVPEDKQVSKQLSNDAMFKLSHTAEDKGKSKDVTPTLARLEDLQDRRWKDDYMANRRLRDQFRTRKKELQAKEEQDAALLHKCSLDIPLLAESKDDRRVAALLRLQPSKSFQDRQREKRQEIESKSSFPLSADQQGKIQQQRSSLGVSLRRKTPSSSVDSMAESCSTAELDPEHEALSLSAGSSWKRSESPGPSPGLSLISADYASSGDSD